MDNDDELLMVADILINKRRPPPVKIGDMWSNCSGRCQASPRDAYCDCGDYRDYHYYY